MLAVCATWRYLPPFTPCRQRFGQRNSEEPHLLQTHHHRPHRTHLEQVNHSTIEWFGSVKMVALEGLGQSTFTRQAAMMLHVEVSAAGQGKLVHGKTGHRAPSLACGFICARGNHWEALVQSFRMGSRLGSCSPPKKPPPPPSEEPTVPPKHASLQHLCQELAWYIYPHTRQQPHLLHLPKWLAMLHHVSCLSL